MGFDGRTGRWPRWIEQQLLRRGIHDERVLRAFERVPRREFVRRSLRMLANTDGPLPIGCGQTISQPFIHARSLEALRLSGHERVLDVGTGSGYQAVLLSHLAREVYTVEVIPELYRRARDVVARWAKAPVRLRCDDGRLGWPEAAPFDAIVVGARADSVPPALTGQLATGGRLVIPIGPGDAQVLTCLHKRPGGRLERTALEAVRFVPLV